MRNIIIGIDISAKTLDVLKTSEVYLHPHKNLGGLITSSSVQVPVQVQVRLQDDIPPFHQALKKTLHL